MKLLRPLFRVAVPAALSLVTAWSPARAAQPQDPDESASEGYAIENRTVVDRCSRCHDRDDDGRMTRISYLRKTPEGWQTSIRRMAALHGVALEADDARAIVRYLADEQGLAPEELRAGLFEVERRLIDYDYPGDSGVEFTCIQCHSMGRVITQRRTEEEWKLLLDTHRALYPLVDNQAFLRSGPPPDSGDARQPMDVAIEHLSETFPLVTPEWSAWAATKRPPRLAGQWALSGYEPGKGPLFGSVTIAADPNDPGAFRTTSSYVYAESGERVSREGDAIVYTGYQWRGRSNAGAPTELREVMVVERDVNRMSGRWFSGAYDESGPDVTLARLGGAATLSGVYPRALPRGEVVSATLYGGGLPSVRPGDLDFGAGVSVRSVGSAAGGALTLELSVAADAAVGARDLYAFGTVLTDAVVVHDGVDRIAVTPETGMARVGGAAFPKGLQTFDAIGYDDGPDGEPDTSDDIELGRVGVSWRLEEYAATLADDDIDFVGQVRADGVFVPALDGPNPGRRGNRNNVGDVWVVARHERADGTSLSARAHLVVTVPLYLRWEPWREIGDLPAAPGGDR